MPSNKTNPINDRTQSIGASAITNNDFIRHEPNGEAKVGLAVFSSVNTPVGKFSFSRQFESVGANRVYVNDRNNGWYFRGIPGLGDAQRSATEVVAAAGNGDPGQVTMFGSSMGAFGAIYYGLLGGARDCLAMGCETRLLTPASRSEQYMEESKLNSEEIALAREVNLVSMLRETPEFRVSLIVAENDALDLHFGLELNQLENVTVHSVRGCGHTGYQYLLQRRELSTLITEFLNNGRVIDYPERGSIYDKPDIIKALYAAYLAAAEGDQKTAEEGYRQAFRLDDQNEVARSHLGIFLANQPNHAGEAIELLKLSNASKPFDASVATKLASLYISHRRYRDAELLLTRSLHIYRPYPPMWALMAEARLGRQDYQRALVAANEANRLAPNGVYQPVVAKVQDALSAHASRARPPVS